MYFDKAIHRRRPRGMTLFKQFLGQRPMTLSAAVLKDRESENKARDMGFKHGQ